MSLSYLWRFAFLCSAAFFIVQAFAGVLARVASPAIVRASQNMAPRRAARFLFVARLFPIAAAALAVLGFCIPSYLWFEPGATHEEVGAVFVAMAVLGASLAVLAFIRAVRAIISTCRFTGECRKIGREITLPGEPAPSWLIESDGPVLVMAGLVRPRIIVSRSVLDALSPEELAVTVRHERAHRAALDNFKRLALLVSSEIVPLVRPLSVLDRAWLKSSEWAADDAASSDQESSISLATALVRVARLGRAPQLTPLCQHLVSDSQDLSARVDRLIASDAPHKLPRTRLRLTVLIAGCAVAVCLAAAASRPETLHSVHELLERFTH
jgi:beta-lactamase regulating signal transducer with metallopeptidase domain